MTLVRGSLDQFASPRGSPPEDLMHTHIRFIALVLVVSACKSKTPSGAPGAPSAGAPTSVPANVSHGEAPIGAGTATGAKVDPTAPP